MSRSFRKRPFAAYCGGSQKKDKQIGNRIMRRTARVEVRVHGEDACFLSYDEAMNPWRMSQDGTRCWQSWLSYQMRHHMPHMPGCRTLDYRYWFRWVKAK